MKNIKPVLEFIKDLAICSGQVVMRIRAVGPLNCKDPEKVKKIWEYYEDKVPYEILDELKSYGDIYCYFETPNEASSNAAYWFPTPQLINESEYDDVDEDFYVSIDCVDARGLPVIGY